MKTKFTKRIAVLTAGAFIAVAVVGGCDKNKTEREKADAEFFKGDGNERVSPTITVQAANGARHDAMLYAHHFDGGHLNSLGRSKVLLMLEDCENCSPITVHMVNCGEGDMLAQRKAAVELYLKSSEGANTLTFHPSAPDIIRLAKTESGELGQGAAGGGADTTAASGGTGGTSPPAGGAH
jgi:hypothetical protein